jgi:hypothetical protein
MKLYDIASGKPVQWTRVRGRVRRMRRQARVDAIVGAIHF